MSDPTDTLLESAEAALSDDTIISSAPGEGEVSVMELFPNFAENDEIVEKTKTLLRSLFANCKDRSDLEDIWEKSDEMYRCKPDPSKDDKHRANEATGVFHISVNQLVSIAFKTFTDNPDNYKYGYRGIIDDEQGNIIKARNAEIMTLLFRKAQTSMQFKKNLKRALLDCYKNGNVFAGLPWEKQIVDLIYRDKLTGDRATKPMVKSNLPGFDFIPIDHIWMDENIGEIEAQPAVFIKTPISWSKLLADSKKNNVKLFDKDGHESLRDKFAKYILREASSEFDTAKQDRMDNADRTYQERTGRYYNHWVVWINLPINKATNKWDENGNEIRFRVRFLGNPESCEIIEIRENIFPGGMPIIAAHQTEDDIGMYHISLGEKIKTYYDQICIGIDQLIDNRSKNTRRPIFYDAIRVDLDNHDFGHSTGTPVEGDPRSAIYEVQLMDMTGTIMATINYCEQKVREIMNTTDAVMGVAMGGRTSALEYMNAKAAATTPIFSDMASIEDALIGEYMRRFAQYIHTFMTLDDIVDQIGPVGAEFQFDLVDIYTVEMRGASEAVDKAMRTQNLLQLFNLSQDAAAKNKILLRIAEAMGAENPAELVSIPAKDQAIKAALWENNEMLVYSQYDTPETGEMHDVHLSIHQQALWQAQRDKNPNVPMMVQHISETRYLQRQEQASAGGSIPAIGQQASQPATPGSEAGQMMSAPMGSQNAGSPLPAQPEMAAPEAMMQGEQ